VPSRGVKGIEVKRVRSLYTYMYIIYTLGKGPLGKTSLVPSRGVKGIEVKRVRSLCIYVYYIHIGKGVRTLYIYIYICILHTHWEGGPLKKTSLVPSGG
jgi:hypothetical protein